MAKRVTRQSTKNKIAPPPLFIEPQLPVRAKKPPQEPGWVYEQKHDGYRIQVRMVNHEIEVRTKNGLVWTDRFKAVVDELTRVNVANAIFDGEMVVLRLDGTSSFADLSSVMGRPDQSRLRYFIFDILYLDGNNLVDIPWIKRHECLRQVLPRGLRHIDLVEHLTSIDNKVLAEATKLGFEGFVAKRIMSPYRSGKNNDWQKIKFFSEQEMVIGGFTEDHGRVEDLYVGYYKGRGLHFAGIVRYTMQTFMRRQLHADLSGIARRTSPFKNLPVSSNRITWVKPQRVVTVRHRGWSANGSLISPSFQGLRQDMKARDVMRGPR